MTAKMLQRPGFFEVLSVRHPSAKVLTSNSTCTPAPSTSTPIIAPFLSTAQPGISVAATAPPVQTRFAQCYNAIWAGLGGDYANITPWTDGSIYLIDFQSGWTGWVGSTFNPPGKTNRAVPAPFTYTNGTGGTYIYVMGFNPTCNLYVSPDAGGATVNLVCQLLGSLGTTETWQYTSANPFPSYAEMETITLTYLGTNPDLAGSSVTVTRST